MEPADYARGARERERVLAGEAGQVREPIRASWTRARRSGLDTDAHLPPVPLVDATLERWRRRHPLAQVWPTLRASLRSATTEPGSLLFLSDADGHLLWVEGDRDTLRRAERVHLVPGARWSETTAGTSGVGTSLALRRPFQVCGPEHFLSVATSYLCTAAPIRDPLSGQVLGAVDLTCGLRGSKGMALSLLTTAAQLAESQLHTARLRTRARLRDRYAERLARRFGTRSAVVTPDGLVVHAEPAGWLPRHLPAPREGETVLPDGQAVVIERLVAGGPFLVLPGGDGERGGELRFTALGRDRALLRVDGVTHELSRRHTELVTVLLAHPDGLSARELCRAVYGPGGNPVTLRAAVARLRPLLGHRLAADPYRIVGAATADFLGPGRSTGELVPGSVAPGVVALRESLT